MKIPGALIAFALVGAVVTAGVIMDRRQEARRTVLSGTFESLPILISARVGGRVMELRVKEGETLSGDAEIARLDVAPDQAITDSLGAQATQSAARKTEVELTRLEEIARQEGVLRELEAILLKVRRGPRPEEIRGARAGVAQAKARFDEAIKGPRTEEIARARSALKEAQARLERTRRGPVEAELQRLRAEIVSAHAQESLTFRELERRRFLVAEGAMAQKLLDQAVADHVKAQKSREAAEAALRAATPRPEDVGIADAQLRQAQESLNLLLHGSRPETISAARESLNQAQANLDLLLSGSRSEDIQAAEARVAQARTVLSGLTLGAKLSQIEQANSAKLAAEKSFASSQLKSKEGIVLGRKGTVVDRILVSVGDLLSPGQPIARLSDPSDLHFRCFIPESALAKVSVGDEVQMLIDGLDRPVIGLVESVAIQGEFTPANLQTPEERGKQVFGVRVRLKEPNALVKPGIAATVQRIGSWEPRS